MSEEQLLNKKKRIVSTLMQEGVMIKPEMLGLIDTEKKADLIISNMSEELSKPLFSDPLKLKEFFNAAGEQPSSLSQFPVAVNSTAKVGDKKINIQDFVSYFNARYQTLSLLLSGRHELGSVISLSRIKERDEKEPFASIAMVGDIRETKNNNILITIEDPTGSATALVTQRDPELYAQAKNLVSDEIIGITGTIGSSLLYVNAIIWPDVPFTKELKKAPDEVYALFLSDVHVGSNYFLKDKFEKLIAWLNGTVGDPEQRKLASKIRYAFIVGDLVDGVGIYPGQQEELYLKDIYDQYKEAAQLLSKFPPHLNIIICPGNHDAVRLAEPQPPISIDLAEDLWKLPNVHMISNPSVINIHKKEGFPGFDVLVYHGYSFDYYIATVDELRQSGGYDRPDLIMKFLLKRRHVAPTHTSTLYVPGPRDSLIINNVPDFFATGHIHKTLVTDYRNITLVSSSCWQSTTDFQEKVGHHPEPARVPLVNLQTREVKILKF